MNSDLLAGLAVTFVPLATIGYLMLRKQAGIFRMYIAMLLIGIGYLTLTGGINDIGTKVLGHNVLTPAEDAAPPAPAGEKISQPAPAEVKTDAAAPAPGPTPAAAEKAPESPPAPADPDVAPQGGALEDAAPPPSPPSQGAGAPAAP